MLHSHLLKPVSLFLVLKGGLFFGCDDHAIFFDHFFWTTMRLKIDCRAIKCKLFFLEYNASIYHIILENFRLVMCKAFPPFGILGVVEIFPFAVKYYF